MIAMLILDVSIVCVIHKPYSYKYNIMQSGRYNLVMDEYIGLLF